MDIKTTIIVEILAIHTRIFYSTESHMNNAIRSALTGAVHCLGKCRAFIFADDASGLIPN